ncbi:hypothetical protein PsYK624_134630 [Phanerochaete sordida]|uniref:Uncharacterized protein n=1 Tax=Phanerochaete sordida TaxID=48140 RepID=A0A9P3GL11_9APHY|nr:hypothetical protein PsYK624_134630 [Phanerochaete sordida]
MSTPRPAHRPLGHPPRRQHPDARRRPRPLAPPPLPFRSSRAAVPLLQQHKQRERRRPRRAPRRHGLRAPRRHAGALDELGCGRCAAARAVCAGRYACSSAARRRRCCAGSGPRLTVRRITRWWSGSRTPVSRTPTSAPPSASSESQIRARCLLRRTVRSTPAPKTRARLPHLAVRTTHSRSARARSSPR